MQSTNFYHYENSPWNWIFQQLQSMISTRNLSIICDKNIQFFFSFSCLCIGHVKSNEYLHLTKTKIKKTISAESVDMFLLGFFQWDLCFPVVKKEERKRRRRNKQTNVITVLMKDVVHFYTHRVNVFSMDHHDQAMERRMTMMMRTKRTRKVMEYSND